jgi:apolipoprotein N-acyltransferase
MTRDEAVLEFDSAALSPGWRTAAGAARLMARGSLVVLAFVTLAADEPPTNPFRQMRLFGATFAAPEVLAWWVRRWCAVRVRVGGGMLVLEGAGSRVEVPVASIAAVEAWALPLPEPGVWLRLRSGRRLETGILLRDVEGFVAALRREGADAAVSTSTGTLAAAYSQVLHRQPAGWAENPLLKFGLLPMVPAFAAFRLHQFITFGGTFGEAYTFGWKAWLLGFFLWWVSWAIGMSWTAAVMRMVAEGLAIATLALSRAAGPPVRRALVILLRVLYYAGIPAWLAFRLLA